MSFFNPYTVLNVSEASSAAEIKAAYRMLVRRHHPDRDKSAGSTDRTKQLNRAWAILGNAAKRSEIDEQLERRRLRSLRRSPVADQRNKSTAPRAPMRRRTNQHPQVGSLAQLAMELTKNESPGKQFLWTVIGALFDEIGKPPRKRR